MIHKPTNQTTMANILYPTSIQAAPSGIMRQHISTLLTQPQPSGIGFRLIASTKEDSMPWIYVIDRFTAFQTNLALTDSQRKDGNTKFNGLTASLNAAYRGNNSQTENAFMIGSWAKDTCIRPPRDVDMYYVLPIEVYIRFESRSRGENKQSAILQEVKNKLVTSYPRSAIKGDGPIVLADFHGFTVEIAPAFVYEPAASSYIVCDTKNGGKYIVTKPFAEVIAINSADVNTNNNTRPLIRMLKCWQGNCSVPIKSFALELLATEFLRKWKYNDGGLFYYDWMCRDFFQWLVNQAHGFVLSPGVFDVIRLGDEWKTRAESAYARAAKACEYENVNNMLAAGDEWQKIFGADIPRNI